MDISKRKCRLIIVHIAVRLSNFADMLAEMRFIPLKVEMLCSPKGFEYTGLSRLFDEIEDGDAIPIYKLNVGLDDGYQIVSVDAEKLPVH